MLSKCAWLIFIRSNSSRLKNKCYLKFNDKTILEHLIERALSSNIKSKDIFLMTTEDDEDQELLHIADRMSINYLLGPEKFPIQRITNNLSSLKNYTHFIRICGDSPFYSFKFVANILASAKNIDFDFLTNTRLRNFPSGMSIEIYKSQYLLSLLKQNPLYTEEEHMSRLCLLPSL